MRFNAGIITSKLDETRKFYTETMGWNIDFENDFYLLLGNDSGSQLSFLKPNHPSQKPLFQSEFSGVGIYITVEVHDVDREYEMMRNKNIPIEIELRDEPWGDRHFAIKDPNGIGVDIVTYVPPVQGDSSR